MKKLLFGIAALAIFSCQNQNDFSGNAHFEWNLSENKTYTYDFIQTIHGESSIEEGLGNTKTYMQGIGDLTVQTKENKMADLSISNLEMTMASWSGDLSPEDTTVQTAPPVVMQDMDSKGQFKDSNASMLFKMLIPLPTEDLALNETNEIEMETPFNVYGSQLISKGSTQLTFTGFEEMEGRNCAVLAGKIDISQLDVPEVLKGNFKYSTTGQGTFYFDLEEGIYVGADIEMLMDVLIDFEDDQSMYTEMKSDNLFKIRLRSVE